MFYNVHIRALTDFKILPTNALLLYTVLQLKLQDSDMLRPFLVGHPQEVYIHISMKQRL